MIQDAIAEWRGAMAAVEAEADPGLRRTQAGLLRGAKATLEEQVGRGWGRCRGGGRQQ